MRYDTATGLDWMSVRAYDPTVGRFISRDPLGRAPLFFADQPYAYAGNNPVGDVDPSGLHITGASNSQVTQQARAQARTIRIYHKSGGGPGCDSSCKAGHVLSDAKAARDAFGNALTDLAALAFIGTGLGFALTKAALETLLKSIAFKALATGLAGAAMPIALGWFAFRWEAQQSTEWFEHRTNVDNFFTFIQWGVGLTLLIVGIAVLANIEAEPVAAVFSISALASTEVVLHEFDLAQREQDKEYSRTTP